MVDLKDYFESIIQANIGKGKDKANVQTMVTFLEDNDWFGARPEMKDGKVMLTDEQEALFSHHFDVFFSMDASSENMLKLLNEKYPLTASQLSEFCAAIELDHQTQFYVTDFLLKYLSKDIALYSNDEARQLVKAAMHELTKAHGDSLTFFMSWLLSKYKTNYCNDYQMNKRYTMDRQNEAYSIDEYTKLMYYLTNAEYIEQHKMYQKAAASKAYADTWLYLSAHFTCSLRLTDLQRIYHPDLPYPPEEILEEIANNTFSDTDARMVLLSITIRLATLPLYPSKTEGTTGIGSVKFPVPHNCEVHYGKLFALPEAHRQVSGTPNEPIIRKISSYQEISRYMGEEIGNLFLENDFCSRSATKSYLQARFMNADNALGSEETTMKGYMLASLARSHKGGYGKYAATTIQYLKDMKLSQYTPQFVAYELLQRGVLSFIPGMLLDMVTDRKYNKISVPAQTSLLSSFDLTPYETNQIIDLIDKAQKQAQAVVAKAIDTGVDIMIILQRIASGSAFSKQAECLCLISACGHLCPYQERRQCVGCRYEISTKSTLLLLADEYQRMKNLYDNAVDQREKEKYKTLITKIVVPKLNEMLMCIKKDYGDECFRDYETLLQQYIK